MSPPLLEIFNHFTDQHCTLDEAKQWTAQLPVLPLPDEIPPDDWRAHVPVPLLEQWQVLTSNERAALYIMALSATHPYQFLPEKTPSELSAESID